MARTTNSKPRATGTGDMPRTLPDALRASLALLDKPHGGTTSSRGDDVAKHCGNIRHAAVQARTPA